MGKTEVRGVQIKDTDITVSDIANGAITEAKLGLTDVTTGNSSTAKHGLLTKLPTPTGLFLKDDGTWDNASGGADTVVLDSGGVNLDTNAYIGWKRPSALLHDYYWSMQASYSGGETRFYFAGYPLSTDPLGRMRISLDSYPAGSQSAGAGYAYIELGTDVTASSIEISADTITANTVPVVTTTAAQALTNKEIVPRSLSGASYSTHTPPIDSYDCFDITAQSVAIAFANPTGTPVNFQKLIIRIKDNGTVRAISWGTSYVAGGVSLPTATVASKITTLGFIYSTAVAKWLLVALATQA